MIVAEIAFVVGIVCLVLAVILGVAAFLIWLFGGQTEEGRR